MRPVDVVIPVYDGYDETVACLRSVLDTVDLDWVRPLIINDCSPNPDITAYLRDLAAAHDRLVLLENTQNLGFVATVNRGMAYDTGRDVLLLNSDVEVNGNWLERMREAAYRHDKTASVTPFSNNATLCSFPNMCEDNGTLFRLPLADIDACFAAEFTVDDVFTVPTGVGCCMYMRRDCLDEVGFFDVEAFGRGYGEENDWCQRAIRAGWANLHLANCFIYHRGGVSFGSEYSPRLANALDVLDRKYPHYHANIQRYIADDPARLVRVRAWLRLFAAQERPRILMISHKLGGGAQQHVDQLARLYGDRALCLLMIPETDGQSVRLSCFDGGERLRDGLFFQIGDEYEKLVALLRGLGIGRVHFHHTMGLPTRLWAVAQDLDCDYDLTIHDYFLVNGNPSMTDSQGRYVATDHPQFDELCAGYRPLPPGVDALTWRENQRMLIEGASRVIFPSQDCKERFTRFFDVASPVVAWHPDCDVSQPHPVPHWRRADGRPLRVLVLGALSKEKGADVLEAAAAALSGERIEFHLLGYAYRRLGGNVVFHGPYDNDDVYGLVEKIDPDVVWFPALWPETYSYTLSVALRCGLPVVVPNIGAFVERVQGRECSAIVDWDLGVNQWRDFWLFVLNRRTLPEQDGSTVDAQAIRRDFYARDYLDAVSVMPATLTSEILDGLEGNLFAHSQKLSRSEWLLNRIWRFSLRPTGARLVALVPFRVQRTIKRALSHRPMHDIVGK